MGGVERPESGKKKVLPPGRRGVHFLLALVSLSPELVAVHIIEEHGLLEIFIHEFQSAIIMVFHALQDLLQKTIPRTRNTSHCEEIRRPLFQIFAGSSYNSTGYFKFPGA